MNGLQKILDSVGVAIVGGVSSLCTAVTPADVTMWVGVVCTAITTLVTCAITAYRAWRDRNNDKIDAKKSKEVQKNDGNGTKNDGGNADGDGDNANGNNGGGGAGGGEDGV